MNEVLKAYGIFMQSYFGGRAECRIRNWGVPVCPVDFMSQYPTVNELLRNWDVLTAERVCFPDATQEVRRLLSKITLERCFKRKLWLQFRFFALVRPDNDILPTRTVYNGTTQNIGINYLTSKEPIWFAGPDIIASILLTGKVPHIEEAIRVVPNGKQKNLWSTSLRGLVEIDANKHSFFKHVIEQRAAHESDPALHYWLKILANSGSYGLFVELNPNECVNGKLRVFSGEDTFETTSDVVEDPGKWFAPHIGSLITAGGRLLLAMLEKCITNSGGNYVFCDTDSAAIVSAERRQLIAMPDGAPPITALSYKQVDEIVQRFEKLNPYNRKLVPGSILKVHKLNWDHNKRRQQLFAYAIAAKRYAEYTKTKDDIEIVEPKAHGLGYFYPPKDSPEGWNHETPQWIFESWDWIIRGIHGLRRRNPSWFDLPVMMKLTLSTPHHALRNLAKGPLTRPNNFMMIPQISRFGYQTAVAAISKNDWQTAKSELLQAKKLAPNNALVHYDLALAYSHTGDIKSAQAELTKALQLGLPSEQKQAAEQLKQQLASHNSVLAATTATHPSASPSLADTLDWLNDKLALEVMYFTYDYNGSSGGYHHSTQTSYYLDDIQGCHLVLVRTDRGNDAAIIKTPMDLSQLRSDIQVTQRIFSSMPGITYTNPSHWEITVYVRDGEHLTSTRSTSGVPVQVSSFSIELSDPTSTPDIAKRIVTALTAAIEKCGGKKVKELY